MYFCQFKSRFLCIRWKYLLLLTSEIIKRNNYSKTSLHYSKVAGKIVMTQGIPHNLIYYKLTEMVKYWFGYWGEKKKIKLSKHLGKSPLFLLPHRLKFNQGICPPYFVIFTPLICSADFGQAPQSGDRPCRRLGSVPSDFFLLLLLSYSPAPLFLLALSALTWLPPWPSVP